MVMGSCHEPTSTPAVGMPVQKQLTQGPAGQVCALTQGIFLNLIVFLFRGGKTNTSPAGITRVLPQ